MPDEKLPIILHTGSSLVQTGTKGGRILSEMVNGTLTLSRVLNADRTFAKRFTINGQELCEPDYQQILLWASALTLEPETMLNRLLTVPKSSSDQEFTTQLVNGRLIRIGWDVALLPLVSFEWVEGLVIEALAFFVPNEYESAGGSLMLQLPKLRILNCEDMGFTRIDLSAVPLLTSLSCGRSETRKRKVDDSGGWAKDASILQCAITIGGFYVEGHYIESGSCTFSTFTTELIKECGEGIRPYLKQAYALAIKWLQRYGFEIIEADLEEAKYAKTSAELDLSAVPLLTSLNCSGNGLHQLDLSAVPLLSYLNCSKNELPRLDLSALPCLSFLDCSENYLAELDLSGVPLLSSIFCSANKLTKLDLSCVPNLRSLHCWMNNITELDLSSAPYLSYLNCKVLVGEARLTELDIRPVLNLEVCECDQDTRIIQRTDQTF
jgi:Leucine-rich repeat (LRR) protein